jgi:hypothetical protein
MKRIKVLLNVGVSLEVDPLDEDYVIEDLEEHITNIIGLDFEPLDVWCEVQDVEDLDEDIRYWGNAQ